MSERISSIQEKYGEASNSSVANNKSFDDFFNLDDEIEILRENLGLSSSNDDEGDFYLYMNGCDDPFFGE